LKVAEEVDKGVDWDNPGSVKREKNVSLFWTVKDAQWAVIFWIPRVAKTRKIPFAALLSSEESFESNSSSSSCFVFKLGCAISGKLRKKSILVRRWIFNRTIFQSGCKTVIRLFTLKVSKPVSIRLREVLKTLFFGSATHCASPPPQPSNFSNYSFWSTTLLTRMTGISLHMQWPLTFKLHDCFFRYGSNSMPSKNSFTRWKVTFLSGKMESYFLKWKGKPQFCHSLPWLSNRPMEG
jgi:hypothetical protein